MATTVHIPIEQYLETSFEDHDPEYVDGEVIERALPNYLHGRIQGSFTRVLGNAGQVHRLFVCVETRMRVSPTRIRIPDVAVFIEHEPPDAVPAEAPFLVVEILSPSDAWTEVMERLRELEDWGVRHLWLADPATRELYVYSKGGVTTVSSLEIAELGIAIRREDVF